MDSSKGAEGLGGGAGEVRRINVVYFLSQGGRTDHPHLFRVNHRSRAGGVRLRDVKRWLAEIRGKDMPGNFSWSYKRKYKAGYVWQDLKDDDLITPVSDNEYVLKGCDVRGTPPRCVQQAPKTTTPSFSLDEKGRTDDDNDKDEKKKTCSQRTDRSVEVVLAQDDSDESASKPPQSPDDDREDSPGSGESARRRSTVRFKIEVSRPQDLRHRRREPEAKAKAVARGAAVASWPASDKQGAGVRSHAVAGGARRMRVARALHNILTCGTADADDAALRPVARRSVAEAAGGDDWTTPTPTCPGVDGCGLRVSRKARSRRGGKEQQGRRDGGKRHGGDAGSKKRHGGDAHKPAALPRCSQCGKEFKPQELHSHMQSCRGFRERMKSSSGSRSDERRRKPGHCSQSQEQQPSSDTAVFLLTAGS